MDSTDLYSGGKFEEEHVIGADPNPMFKILGFLLKFQMVISQNIGIYDDTIIIKVLIIWW